MATLTNKGQGRWKVQVSAGSEYGQRKRPTKTFQVDPGKTENAQRREVEAQAKAWEVDLRRGILSASNKVTIAQLAREWQAGYVQRKKLAPSTQAHYRVLLEGRVLPRIGRLYVQDIKAKEINAFISWVEQDAPKSKRAKGNALSGTTCKKYYILLSSLFGFAMRQGYISVNPVATVTPPKGDTPEQTPYTPEQARKFMNALGGESLKWRTYFHLALLSSMRRGELIALSWDDIDLTTGMVCIAKSAYYSAGNGVIVKQPKTTAGKRMITVPLWLCALLEEHHTEQALQRLKIGSEWHETGAVFTQWNGTRLHLDSPSKKMREIIQREGLPPQTPHGLRHTGASLLIAGGVDYKTVQHRLGHSRASTTMDIYAHHFDSTQPLATAYLDALFTGAKIQAK